MRFGLIGASTIASRYMIDAIRSVEGCEIAWVHSNSAERGMAFAQNYSLAGSSDNLTELLGDPSIGAVYISPTNEKHFPQAMAAIEAGKHVLCEKPIALNLRDASQMVEAAKRSGVVLATNHHLRNAGAHITIQNLIQSGRVGSVLSVRVHHAVSLPVELQGWRINEPTSGGGVILDITVHDADTVRFYLNEDPKVVAAVSANSGLGQGVEDSAMSIWEMPSGAMIFTHESFSHGYAGTSIEVHGTQGSIFARDVMTQEPVGSIELVTEAGREVVPFSGHNLYERSVSRFVSAINGGGEPAAEGVDGLKSLAVALAVREAANSGRAIKVKYRDFEYE